MKKLIAVLFTAIALAGCSQNTQTVEESFVSIIRENYPNEVRNRTNEEIIGLGRQTCQVLDNGITVEELAEELINSNVDPKFAGTILGASVNAFCPQHLPELRRFLDSHDSRMVA